VLMKLGVIKMIEMPAQCRRWAWWTAFAVSLLILGLGIFCFVSDWQTEPLPQIPMSRLATLSLFGLLSLRLVPVY
jgi:hypothetical protein